MASRHLRALLASTLLCACADDQAPLAPDELDGGASPTLARDAMPRDATVRDATVRDATVRDATVMDARGPAPNHRAPAADASTGDPQPDAGSLLPDAFSLRVLTYNVAGLPQGISQSNPSRNSGLISPLLNDYDLALLQEDFSYHAQIVSQARHPHRSPAYTGGSSLGDGLSFLSTQPFEEASFARSAWRMCFGVLDSGSDCLTPKGFTFTRFTVDGRYELDVYDVHADAGSAAGDLSARADNLRQLAEAIEERSEGRAVLVVGDFNARYTRVGDVMHELLERARLRDAWVELVRAGDLPVEGPGVPCDATDANDPACERIDKVLYRGGSGVALTPRSYQVEGAKFVDDAGTQLSDHRPIAVRFELTHAR